MSASQSKPTIRVSHLSTSDFGEVWFADGPHGLWRINYGTDRARFLADLAGDGVAFVEDERATSATRKALAEYFAGKRREFALPIDWSRVSGFTRKALQVCARIPYGQTLSYGEVAAKAGSPGGARAVGQAMGKNPFPPVVPCHRVLAAGKRLGGFSGNLSYKRALLELEGAEARPNGKRR